MKISQTPPQCLSSRYYYDKEIGDYIIKQTIGEGAFSKVKLSIHKTTNSLVAIKILDKSKMKQDDLIHIQREIKILTRLNHPNIITVNEIFENRTCYYIVMEYCPEGELFNYIVHKKRLSEEEASLIFYQLMNGLDYIHSNCISHRDLKPENILLLSNRTIKIIDFGLSNYIPRNQMLKTPCGSPCYAAPEMIMNKPYDGKAVDIWSAGIILYAMVFGYLPFEDRDNQKLFTKVIKNKPQFPKNANANVRDIIIKMLSKEPSKRITMDEIKQHPFYLQGRNIYNIKFSTMYDDLNILKNFTSRSSAAFPTDRNSNLQKISDWNERNERSERNDDGVFVNGGLSEDDDSNDIEYNDEEIIYEKEAIPTFETKVPPITKLMTYSAVSTLNNIEEINPNEEEERIIKVNKCSIKHKRNREIKISPLSLSTSQDQPKNFGLATYNMFKNKIAFSRRLNSNVGKRKIRTIMNISDNNKIKGCCYHDVYKKKNTSFTMTFYNAAKGKFNTSIEVENLLHNKKIVKEEVPVAKKVNWSLLAQESMKGKKKRMNQSIDQDIIIEKFYKKFNLKRTYDYGKNKNINININKKQKIFKVDLMASKAKLNGKQFIESSTVISEKKTLSDIKEKENKKLNKSNIIVNNSNNSNNCAYKRNINEKGRVCQVAKTVITLKEKLNSYRVSNLLNLNNLISKQSRKNSQIKQIKKPKKFNI